MQIGDQSFPGCNRFSQILLRCIDLSACFLKHLYSRTHGSSSVVRLTAFASSHKRLANKVGQRFSSLITETGITRLIKELAFCGHPSGPRTNTG